MQKVLILTDHDVDMYNWRRELIEGLKNQGDEVYLALPYGKRVELLKQMGCHYFEINIDRRGKNPIKDLKLIINYFKLLEQVKPGVVLTYGTKPNIYGGVACRIKKIPYIQNINGLGSGITDSPSVFTRFLNLLYKAGAGSAHCVFFQNSSDQKYCLNNRIVRCYNELLPGSGVNLSFFSYLPFPKGNKVIFTYIARIMREKGIEEFLDASVKMKASYGENVEFQVLGFCEEAYEDRLRQMNDEEIIKYYGMQQDVRPYIEKSHCVVMPSFYGEGMSNTLLESAASGRAIITTGLPGCGETLEDGVTGFIVKPRDATDLLAKMKKFYTLSLSDKEAMGIKGRNKMMKEFDRSIVVEKYLRKIGELKCDK